VEAVLESVDRYVTLDTSKIQQDIKNLECDKLTPFLAVSKTIDWKKRTEILCLAVKKYQIYDGSTDSTQTLCEMYKSYKYVEIGIFQTFWDKLFPDQQEFNIDAFHASFLSQIPILTI